MQDALARLVETPYPLEEKLPSPLPQGLDPQHREVHLSDRDFQVIHSEQDIESFIRFILSFYIVSPPKTTDYIYISDYSGKEEKRTSRPPRARSKLI